MISGIYTPNKVRHQVNHQSLIGDLRGAIGAHLIHYRPTMPLSPLRVLP